MTALVRPVRRGDLAAVHAIEASSYSNPWSLHSFESLLERPLNTFLVADVEGEVRGYGILWWVGDEGEVANVAVAPGARRSGLGAQLLDALLERARAAGVARVFLEVRESNAGAIALYESRGFADVGFRRGYYTQPREDARVMALFLDSGQDTV